MAGCRHGGAPLRLRFGFSLITAVFADRVDLYFARQLVLERLIAAKEKLPKGSDPVLGLSLLA